MRKPLVAVLFAVALGFAALPLVSVWVLGMQDGNGGGQVLVPVTNEAGSQTTGAARGTGDGGGNLLGFRMAEASDGAEPGAGSDEPMTAVPKGEERGRERYGLHTGGKREGEGCERSVGVPSGT